MAGSVEDGRVVVIHYTLRNAEGEVLDSSTGRDPMPYLHGSGNIVPGLETQLLGKSEGDKVECVVPAAQGYGERVGAGAQAVPRREFPKDMQIQKGMPLRVEGSDGQPVTVWITDVRGSRVFIDVNHPLAGVDLHFDVEIVRIRDALPNEVAHGHPHGLDGNQSH